jgi:hypothetical protein
LPGGRAHIIPPGNACTAMLEADRVNLALDAIDDAHDHIVFVGEYDALRSLFALVDGRFDTVIEIEATDHQARGVWSAPGTLFGSHVEGIEILRLAGTTAERRPASRVRPSAEALA